MRALLVGALVAGVAGWGATAYAEAGQVRWPPGGTPTCTALPPDVCSVDTMCASGLCLGGLCAPVGALLCSTTGDLADCRPNEEPLPFGAIYICVPLRVNTCSEQRECFVAPGTDQLVGYYRGDCDADLIANGDEDARNDVCMAERPLGVVSTAGTCERSVPCGRGDTDACSPSEVCASGGSSDVGGTCGPRDRPLYCCEGELGCRDPSVTCAPDTTGSFGLCQTQRFCPGLTAQQELECFRMNGVFVDPEDGDCDTDMDPNDEDPTPCPDDVLPPGDSGPPDVDGGPAGTTDGGAGIDAGALTQRPRFGGGGGCACRASPVRSPEPPWLLGLGLLAVAWRARGARA